MQIFQTKIKSDPEIIDDARKYVAKHKKLTFLLWFQLLFVISAILASFAYFFFVRSATESLFGEAIDKFQKEFGMGFTLGLFVSLGSGALLLYAISLISNYFATKNDLRSKQLLIEYHDHLHESNQNNQP